MRGTKYMETKIQELKGILSTYETIDLLGYISTKFITLGNDGEEIAINSNIFNKTELDSPYKQYIYLIGLLMSTDYCDKKNTNEEVVQSNSDKDKYKEIEDRLQNITMEYIKFFIPENKTLDELQEVSEYEKNKILVTMKVFLSYFNTDILRYEEQIIERLKLLAMPFNNFLVSEFGISVSEFISFYNFINNKFLDSTKKSANEWQNYLTEYDKIMRKVKKISDTNEAYQFMLDESKKMTMINFQQINNMFIINKDDIISKYGIDKANKFIEMFSLERKERNFIYYNNDNIFEEKPLCFIDNNRMFIVHPKIILSAIYRKVIKLLEQLDKKKKIKFYETRGNKIEEFTLQLFRNIFGDKGKYYTSVCEIYGSEEHDLLIEYEDKLFIIEIKSSKTKTPLFNPDKSYKLILDHFNSKVGIGGGYKQAKKLKQLILSNEETILYNEKTKPFKIFRDNYKDIYMLVITFEQFGPLNINISSLVELDEKEQYPWSCNLYDLENIIDMIKYMEKNADDLIKYIAWRIEKHDRIIANDELEILEMYFIDGKISKSDEIIYIPTLEYNLADKIYYEKHGIKYNHPNFKTKNIFKKYEIGRNDPCSCGSFKKYKKCCGKF